MGWLIEVLPLAYTDAVVTVGAALLGLVAGVVGSFAVLRRRSMMGDALAHAALPGVCLAFLATGTKNSAGLLAGAALAGLVGATVIVGVERTSRLRADAAIGVVLSGFFSLGLVLLTAIGNRPDADQAGLERYLFGQAAGLSEADVTVMAFLAVAALAAVVLGFRAFKMTLFDQGFAATTGLPVRVLESGMSALLVLAILVGLRTVGAILMIAMLVTPVTAARQLTDRLVILLPLAGAVGAGIGVTGSLLSARSRTPTGPVIVIVAITVVIGCVLLAPRRGVVWHAYRLHRARRAGRVAGHRGPVWLTRSPRAAAESRMTGHEAAGRTADQPGAITTSVGGGHP